MAIVELRDTIDLGFGQIQKAIEDPWRIDPMQTVILDHSLICRRHRQGIECRSPPRPRGSRLA